MRQNWIKPDWPLPPGVCAASTMRFGGHSESCYSSFNLALHVGDDPARVHANRAHLRQSLNLPAEPLWLEQVHGDLVVHADTAQNTPQADASFTFSKGVVCAVMTADCLPVLFYGIDNGVIAAAHAGWRGLYAGILTQTLRAMQAKHVSAWLGPAIGPQQFEVGPEVRNAFVQKNPACAQAFKIVDAEHYLADLYTLARLELTQLGISEIFGGSWCTYNASEDFFSYRRDGQTGRMASLIWKE